MKQEGNYRWLSSFKYWGLSALLWGGQAFAQTIAVSQIVEHPALNDVYRGIQEELKEQGFDGIQYVYENAQGNGAIALQIAEKIAGLSPDVAVAIGTPSAQALQSALQGSKPLVFAAVTDPVEANLVSNWQDTSANITGVSDQVSVEQHLDLILEIKPDAKRIGTIYNAGEANSVSAIRALQSALQTRGLTLVEAAATKTSEVMEAAQSLVGQVDVVYVVQDNTVISAIKAVLTVAEEQGWAVFSADTGSVREGALATVSFDYEEVGREAGKQVAEILRGKKVSEIAVTNPQKTVLMLNEKTVKRLNLTISEALWARAQEVVK
ncbi:MAG: ABC transporter substrate-binding protein [Cardiobacteriaceae bacterium]|nr:ABC transporter substrate-binding protein [Cardiobacteriaceae bacterium]